MACGSGCGSGGCSSGGCNKLNVYDWLSDMSLPMGQQPYPIVEVRFKGSRKEFFRNKDNVLVAVGDVVAVEGNPGHDIGVVSVAGELVKLQMKKNHLKEDSDTIKALFRKAKQTDIEKWEQVRALESNTLNRTRQIIIALKLSMKLSDVEYQGDGKKATFYYTADERVDFRELIKKLAEEFKMRIEMRQIGMRQEAGRLGGIGSCGRELCCSSWLTDFRTVSTGAARYQNLSLNPAKLAGQCGKLKCCLNFELDSYMDALKDIPNSNIALETEKGRAHHRKTDIFKRRMWYAYQSFGDNREGGAEMNFESNWVMISVDRVKEIIQLNKQQMKPVELRDENDDDIVDDTPDYENVVGQDSIDRLDKLRKKKKKKKKPSAGNQQQNQQAQNAGQSSGPQNQGQQKQQQERRPQQQNQQQQNRNQQRPQQGGNKNRPQGNQQSQNKPQQQPQQNKPQAPKPDQERKPNHPPRKPLGGNTNPPTS